MPPKRSKARESSSQPLPESRAQPRKNTKRRLSDASEASDRPSSSQSLSTPSRPKRRKGANTVAEPEVILEEEETIEVAEDNTNQQPTCDTDGNKDLQTTQLSQEKHVHFGQAEAGAQQEDPDDTELERSTATHITPHPRKMTIKRRATTSPSVRVNGDSKRVKVTTSRTSLPTALIQDGQSPFYILEERHFAPLREVLQERVQRRWTVHAGRDEHIHQLELELETQSQLGNVERVQELDEAISKLRSEYNELVTEGDEVVELDEDMLVFDGEDVTMHPQMVASGHVTAEGKSKLSKVSYRAENLTLADSQGVQEAWNAERRKFEDAIVALSREANEAKTELQILKIELLALGFGGEDVSISTVLLSIRESFTRIREGLEFVLPDSVPEEVSNQNLIEILLANIKDFADRLHTQDYELQQRTTLVGDLSGQVTGLVDHLAEAKIRNQKLEQGWGELDKSNEDKARRLGNLEEDFQKIEDDRDALEDDLNAKTEEVQALRTENGELVQGLERLTESLQKYRDEEARLTALISRMEEEHQVSVSKMNREREETVRELEDQIDSQTRLRNDAETLAEERQTMIIGLELRVEAIEGERDALRIELDNVLASRDEEQGARKTAEAELEEKSAEVEDLEGRVDRLEEELVQLNVQLEDLRQVNETERAQRETAEADLDERNADVEQLNQRLRDQGIQANELRQKLYEVQQLNAEKVKELEQAAVDHDKQYQIDIAMEVERRASADDLAQQRADAIAALELRLETLEVEMRETIAVRDERVEALEEEVAEKNGEIETLRSDLRAAEELYESKTSESTLQRQDLEASIAALKITITEYELRIAALREEATYTVSLHDSEMDDRNAHIADLNHRIAALTTQVSDLESDKSGLEKRVEQEAEQMLQTQTEQQGEIDSLKATIRDKQAKILLVEQKVQETDQHWQEVLAARDVEIASLTTTSYSTSQTLTAVSADLHALKRKFREYVRRSSGRISALQEALVGAQAVVDAECVAAASDSEQMLEELAAMAEYSEVVVSESQQTVSESRVSSQHQHSQVKKLRGRKRRVVDSGVGMDMDGEADD